jgi:hypothetical protein
MMLAPDLPPPPVTVAATAYCSGSVNAEGGRPRLGQVAVLPGTLPLGSLIVMVRPRRVLGRRLFRVADHIGSGSRLDFYVPPPAAEPDCGFGRRVVTYRQRPRVRGGDTG